MDVCNAQYRDEAGGRCPDPTRGKRLETHSLGTAVGDSFPGDRNSRTRPAGPLRGRLGAAPTT